MIRMTRMLLRACYGAGASCIVHLQCSLLLREAISEGAAGRISAMTLCLSLANAISRSRLAHVTSLGSVEGASVEAWIAFLYACLANFKSQGGPTGWSSLFRFAESGVCCQRYSRTAFPRIL